jgi:DNA-binding protein Fis
MATCELGRDTEMLDRVLDGLNLAEVEQLAINSAVRRCGGNITKAAKMLGISRRGISLRRRKWIMR